MHFGLLIERLVAASVLPLPATTTFDIPEVDRLDGTVDAPLGSAASADAGRVYGLIRGLIAEGGRRRRPQDVGNPPCDDPGDD